MFPFLYRILHQCRMCYFYIFFPPFISKNNNTQRSLKKVNCVFQLDNTDVYRIPTQNCENRYFVQLIYKLQIDIIILIEIIPILFDFRRMWRPSDHSLRVPRLRRQYVPLRRKKRRAITRIRVLVDREILGTGEES